ncbi:Uncharacterised protein [Vibrio cholerae]|nr:Uncharacterised protein [Vibrio cholerae]
MSGASGKIPSAIHVSPFKVMRQAVSSAEQGASFIV